MLRDINTEKEVVAALRQPNLTNRRAAFLLLRLSHTRPSMTGSPPRTIGRAVVPIVLRRYGLHQLFDLATSCVRRYSPVGGASPVHLFCTYASRRGRGGQDLPRRRPTFWLGNAHGAWVCGVAYHPQKPGRTHSISGRLGSIAPPLSPGGGRLSTRAGCGVPGVRSVKASGKSICREDRRPLLKRASALSISASARWPCTCCSRVSPR